MKRLAYVFILSGLVAIVVGVARLFYDYSFPPPADVHGYGGETNDFGYASFFRFLTWIFGGVIATALGAYFRSIHMRKHHELITAKHHPHDGWN